MNEERKVKFNFTDGKSNTITIGKIVKAKGKRNVMYFDKLSNGVWRIIVSDDLVPEITNLNSIEFDL